MSVCLKSLMILMLIMPPGFLLLRIARPKLSLIEWICCSYPIGLAFTFLVERLTISFFNPDPKLLLASSLFATALLTPLLKIKQFSYTKVRSQYGFMLLILAPFCLLTYWILDFPKVNDSGAYIPYVNTDYLFHLAVSKQMIISQFKPPFQNPFYYGEHLHYTWAAQYLVGIFNIIFKWSSIEAWQAFQLTNFVIFTFLLVNLMKSAAGNRTVMIQLSTVMSLVIMWTFQSFFYLFQPRGLSLVLILSIMFLVLRARSVFGSILILGGLCGFLSAESSKPAFSVIVGLLFFFIFLLYVCYQKQKFRQLLYLSLIFVATWLIFGGSIFLSEVVFFARENPTGMSTNFGFWIYYAHFFALYGPFFLLSIFYLHRFWSKINRSRFQFGMALFCFIILSGIVFPVYAILDLIYPNIFPSDFRSLFIMPDLPNFICKNLFPFMFFILLLYCRASFFDKVKSKLRFFSIGIWIFLIFVLVYIWTQTVEVEKIYLLPISRWELFFFGILPLSTWIILKTLKNRTVLAVQIISASVMVSLFLDIQDRIVEFQNSDRNAAFSGDEVAAARWASTNLISLPVFIANDYEKVIQPFHLLTNLQSYYTSTLALTTLGVKDRLQRASELESLFKSPQSFHDGIEKIRKKVGNIVVYINKKSGVDFLSSMKKKSNTYKIVFENKEVIILDPSHIN